MDTIREYSNKPIVVGVAGLIVGVILGVIYGWVINPVEWTNAAARDLRPDLQEEWLRMSIDSYELYRDPVQAQANWAELQPAADETLEAIKLNPGSQSPQAIADFEAVVVAAPTPEEAEEGGGLGTLLPIMCLVVVLLAAALGGVYYLRQRSVSASGGRPATAAEQAQYASQEVERTDYAAIGEEAPIGQFMTTYMLGDDLFDDSFSIDSPSGEFLGECGVGISETIGVGDPKRVTAFEVWLFDKNDIQTVTKVLMSQHAYLDEDIRQRLAAKGEPVLAEPGTQVELTTATLRLVARVVDMAYGEGDPLPDESHFERITLELAVWPAEM
ncbi:MAG: hypothetical protein ACK2UW_02445 [Anaerolineales bacterium]|jgi:hypothetical protein